MEALSKSIQHFEAWKSTRMINYISVMIADEYSITPDLQKASNIYNRCLHLYEKESWTPLVAHIKDRLSFVESSIKAVDS